ncbi:hypothetical protein DFA_07051 [Cavenderia fasciculata]|uniref:very-long-chain (3R)-3-hydroxyacyl-CoA dehydratase n=1 Tax=Cavenderia fasciculata TaxID=261658 RepID=F4PVC9_CACFS|nr:uncharacterized protein DFA_07051 [Cavenderia fasciculata]EGG19943.1 hypothetical protein DFA_07051 [Cavenderia fasciculata]|eukprot:XP_004366926.1 hypothetical protein DFA_07051 [Cavenderia fasciculata]
MTNLSNKDKYLVVYNSFQALGWYYLIISMIMRFLFQGTSSIFTTFMSLGSIVCTLQVVAFLEILHVYFGLVKSGSIMPTIFQVFGRNHVLLWALCYVYPAQEHWSVFLMCATWGVSELIRYPYYIASTLNECPKFLEWLRYNAFIVLYPLGFAAENILWYQMLPIILARKIHFLIMPNSYNFSFNYYYFALVWIISTLLLFPQQYLYMFSLRKKKMSNTVPKKKTQ